MSLPWLDDAKFPAVETALKEPNGLLAAGGDLSPQRLIEAYRHGIFPWYEEGQPVLWWSPDPRMVIVPCELHISASLRRLLRNHQYNVTMDTGFSEVIDACSQSRQNSDGTWITPELKQAYIRLHELGIAHSVEVWEESNLVGGLYGLAFGQLFFGESMFSRQANTSKLALVYLVKQLEKWDFQLIDCQVSSNHLKSLGARDIRRSEFLNYLSKYFGQNVRHEKWQLNVTKQQLTDEL